MSFLSNSSNIEYFLNNASKKCGVYIIFNIFNEIIYVGKAKNLKKRLLSYFNHSTYNCKTKAIIKNMKNINFIVTSSENEALLLEQNYIKTYKPRYNVLYRDDKSYKFIFISKEKYPCIKYHKGVKNEEGDYFGPFPNINVIKKILTTIQKIFPIRQCENVAYYNRSRHCLKYQIGYCLGPCVDKSVSEEEYNRQVEYARLFLSGNIKNVINILTKCMKQSSKKMEFEKAAQIRDQIKLIENSVGKNFLSFDEYENIDVISIIVNYGIICVYIFFIRYGKILNSNSYFFKIDFKNNLLELLQNFLEKIYFKINNIYSIPEKIILDSKIKIQKKTLKIFIKNQTNKNIIIGNKYIKKYIKIINLARINAKFALFKMLSKSSILNERLISLSRDLKIKSINKIECFDVSHNMGECTTASCIVFGNKKFLKSEYRIYDINNITPGDDCAAIKQVIFRHYKRKKNILPDIIIIDGGKNQINSANNAFEKLNINLNEECNDVMLLGISKKYDKISNLENIYLKNKYGKILKISLNELSLNFVRYIRDEAHNYAIHNHRNKLNKLKISSVLELIDGIGLKRSKLILRHLNGLNQFFNVKIEELVNIPGISYKLAKRVFKKLRNINLCS